MAAIPSIFQVIIDLIGQRLYVMFQFEFSLFLKNYIFCIFSINEEGEETWLSDISVSSLSGCILLLLYIRTLHPSVPGGDSGKQKTV